MGDPSLKQWFEVVDKDSNGYVSAQELQQALSRGGIHFSLQTVASLIRMFDPENTGCVDFGQFQHMHEFVLQSQNNFRLRDRNGDGKLSRDEVGLALQEAGFNLSTEAFSSLFSVYDPLSCGHLTLTEFLALTVFLRSASGVFEGFAQGGPRVSLTFDQFIFATSHC